MFVGELSKVSERFFEIINVGLGKSGSVRTEEIVADWGGLKDGEDGIVFLRNAKGLVAFEFLELFPGSGLQKMLFHDLIIA